MNAHDFRAQDKGLFWTLAIVAGAGLVIALAAAVVRLGGLG